MERVNCLSEGEFNLHCEPPCSHKNGQLWCPIGRTRDLLPSDLYNKIVNEKRAKPEFPVLPILYIENEQ